MGVIAGVGVPLAIQVSGNETLPPSKRKRQPDPFPLLYATLFIYHADVSHVSFILLGDVITPRSVANLHATPQKKKTKNKKKRPTTIKAVNNAKKSINPAYTNAAIATENEICSELGVSILKQNGSAVDAAITSTLCIGVVNPQSSGIGGGGFMLVYDDGVARTIDFREMAPAASSLDMYTGYSDCMSTGSGGQGDNTRCPSRLGGLAVGVPGELLGLERAHELYGRLPWSQVVGPVAELCRSGFPVSGALASSIRSQIGSLMNDTLMAELFAPRGVMLTEGQIIVRPVSINNFLSTPPNYAFFVYVCTSLYFRD